MPRPFEARHRSTPDRVVLSVRGGPRAPAEARAALAAGVLDAVPPRLHCDLVLMASELVSNAVDHGRMDERRTIELGVAIEPGRVRVQVSDDGPGFADACRSSRLDEPRGWGLLLVELLAARWGVHDDRPTAVWFELDI
jgi:anti-sigma regulatory factor (Ser/Thr protein kinase)